MSLYGILNIGKSGMVAQQAAIQVTGNNIANAGNADYTRQVATLSPSKDSQIQPGTFVGNGVDLTSVQRQVDEALQARLRGSMSDSASADTTQQWLGQVESVFNALGDSDLSSQFSTFFNGWSSLANKPQDVGQRQVVLENGDTLASSIRSIRGQLTSLQNDADNQLKSLADNANQLAQKIADLNGQIVIAEGSTGGSANGLRDQRDAVLSQLAKLVDIQTTQSTTGAVNVYVGSEPLVADAQNRGIALRQDSINGELTSTIIFKADGGAMKLSGGQIGALSDIRNNQIGKVVDQLDGLAGGLIFALNKIHASGQGLAGFNNVSSDNRVDDSTVPLNSAQSGLAFAPNNGSFVVHVKNKTTGLETSTLVKVDLAADGSSGTSLNSLTSDLDAIDNISAKIVNNRLQITTDSSDVEVSFSQDSSGTLAALGINTFFSGRDARDIAVNSTIRQQPTLLAAAQNGAATDNQTALAIAGLQSQSLSTLGGANLTQAYQTMVNGVGVAVSGAKANAQATTVVQQTLQSQRDSLSGVSMDEEAINLMRQQRAFQAPRG